MDWSLVSLDKIGLSNRSHNALRRKGIHNVADLLELTVEDLQSIPQIGAKSVQEIVEKQQQLLNDGNDSVMEEKDHSGLSSDCLEWLEDKVQKERLLQYLKEQELSIKELTDLGARPFNSLMRNKKDSLYLVISSPESELLEMRGMGDVAVLDLKYSIINYLEKNKDIILEWDRNTPDLYLDQNSNNESEENSDYWLLKYADKAEKVKEFFETNDTPIVSLLLPDRAKNALKRAGFNKLSEIILLSRGDLSLVRGLGSTSLLAIENLLEQYVEIYSSQLDAYVSGEDNALYSDEMIRSMILALYKDNSFEGLGLRDIQNRLNISSLVTVDRLKRIIGKLIADKKLEYVDFRCYLVHQKVADLVVVCPTISDRDRELVLKRLSNKTLEEIGQEMSITRERVRQIVLTAMRKVHGWYLSTSGIEAFDEDYYAYFYQKYDFDKKTGNDWFGLDIATECYLDMITGKREGAKLDKALNDEKLDYSLRIKVQNYLNRNAIYIDDQYVRKNRSSIEDYVLSKYCREEVSFSQFKQIYNDFLVKEGIDDQSLFYTDEVARSRNNRMRDNDLLLWKPFEMLRYYDIKSQDYSELLQTLSLDSYENIELSTLHFMELYPDIMRKYDIRDQYELHNLMRKIIPEGSYNSIHFGRMPTIRFGTFDRDSAIFDVIVENSPISTEDLCKILHDEYGYDAGTIMGAYLGIFAEYYHQGFYSVDQKEMSTEHMAILKEALEEDFYFLDEIRAKYRQLVPDPDLEEINPFNLKRMGFIVLSGYVLKNYSSLDEYFTYLLTREDVTDITRYRQRYGYVGAFSQSLVNLKRAKEVFEFEPNQLISIRRIERNGITRKELEAFCNQVYEFTDERSFNIRSLQKDGFKSDIFDLGFSDQFYNDILSMDGRFAYTTFFGTIILSKKLDSIMLSTFLKELIDENNGIDVYDLVAELEVRYGCSVPEKHKVIYSAKKEGCYHDTIMDRLYASKEAYYQDVYTEEV